MTNMFFCTQPEIYFAPTDCFSLVYFKGALSVARRLALDRFLFTILGHSILPTCNYRR